MNDLFMPPESDAEDALPEEIDCIVRVGDRYKSDCAGRRAPLRSSLYDSVRFFTQVSTSSDRVIVLGSVLTGRALRLGAGLVHVVESDVDYVDNHDRTLVTPLLGPA